jgi:hypothetical protein
LPPVFESGSMKLSVGTVMSSSWTVERPTGLPDLFLKWSRRLVPSMQCSMPYAEVGRMMEPLGFIVFEVVVGDGKRTSNSLPFNERMKRWMSIEVRFLKEISSGIIMRLHAV